MLVTVLYNFLIFAVWIAALTVFRSRPTAAWAIVVMMALAAASCVAAVVLRPSIFGAMGLVAWGVFVHAPLVLVALACLLWRKSRWSAVAAALCAPIVVAVGVDAFFIEPTWLEVTRLRITSPKLTAPLKVVVIADLQTDVVGRYERDVIRRALDEQPDVILLAGDYLQIHDVQRWNEVCGLLNEMLREADFRAPLGIYAVTGNVDHRDWPEIFAGLPVTIITRTESIDLPRDDLRITGLSMLDSFNSRTKVAGSERFHICLGHCPNFALGPVEADLLVAGHTHGGQVRLPLIGPLMTLSQIPRSWAAGLTQLEGGRRLLVSRGIGMERSNAPRLRFLCRPELVVIELVPGRSKQ